MVGIPQAQPNPARLAEQRAECYRLKLRGLTVRAIADALSKSHPEWDLSYPTVWRRIQDEAKDRVQPLSDQVRQEELDRMDIYVEKLFDQLERGGKGVPRVIEVAMKVAERRAKLLGLDAPERQIIAEVPVEDIELVGLIEQARLHNAIEEQVLREGNHG